MPVIAVPTPSATASASPAYTCPPANPAASPTPLPSPSHEPDDIVVLVLVFLDPAGNPKRAEIAQSSGIDAFDDASIRAAMKWKYTPEMRCAAVAGTYYFWAIFKPR